MTKFRCTQKKYHFEKTKYSFNQKKVRLTKTKFRVCDANFHATMLRTFVLLHHPSSRNLADTRTADAPKFRRFSAKFALKSLQVQCCNCRLMHADKETLGWWDKNRIINPTIVSGEIGHEKHAEANIRPPM